MTPVFYPSSTLPDTRKTIARLNLRPLDSQLACLRLVVDTNALLSAIECIVKSGGAHEPAVRELLKAGAAALYAPPHVATEVRRNLDDLATRLDVSRADVDEAWDSVRRFITFVPVPRSALALESLRALQIRDASDAPIAALALRLRADALVTRDGDFAEVPGLQRASGPDLLRMRDVVRAEAEQTGMRVSVTVATRLAVGGGVALWKLSRWLVVGIAVAGLLLLFFWPGAREAVGAVVGGLVDRDAEFGRRRSKALTSMPRSLAAALLPGVVA